MSATFVIAEIGINHNGSLDIAKQLIDAAAAAGCDAVKFQKRTIDEVYTKEDLDRQRESPWGTTNRHQKNGLEFNKKEYDYFKFNGRVRANESSFEKRNDKHHFVRLSKIYKEDDLTKFLVSNFVKTKNMWVGNVTSSEGRNNYIAWKARIQGLPYVFENEIDSLFEENENFNVIFDVVDGQHPPILRYVFGEEVSLETFIILDSILHFIPVFNEKIQETVIWPELYSMCTKYAP